MGRWAGRQVGRYPPNFLEGTQRGEKIVKKNKGDGGKGNETLTYPYIIILLSRTQTVFVLKKTYKYSLNLHSPGALHEHEATGAELVF